MICLVNAFSINMMNDNTDVRFTRVSNPNELLEQLNIEPGSITNAIGHPSTDTIVSSMIDYHYHIEPGQRMNVNLNDYIHGLLVAQYRGPRLPEGATELPEGATIEWWHVNTI